MLVLSRKLLFVFFYQFFLPTFFSQYPKMFNKIYRFVLPIACNFRFFRNSFSFFRNSINAFVDVRICFLHIFSYEDSIIMNNNILTGMFQGQTTRSTELIGYNTLQNRSNHIENEYVYNSIYFIPKYVSQIIFR